MKIKNRMFVISAMVGARFAMDLIQTNVVNVRVIGISSQKHAQINVKATYNICLILVVKMIAPPSVRIVSEARIKNALCVRKTITCTILLVLINVQPDIIKTMLIGPAKNVISLAKVVQVLQTKNA
jgi:hypothetical protein